MSKNKLRFKDDNGNEYPEWVEKTIEEVGDLTGSGIDKKIKEGEMPVRLVNFMDVYNNSFIKSDILNHWVTATEEQIKQKSVKRGDIFFTPSSETPDDIAFPSVAIEDIPDAGYSYHVYRLRPTVPVIPEFMTYSFNSEFFHKQACTLSQGSGTRYTIPLSKFKEMKTLLPSLPEQEKIAALFSKLDERIELSERKIASLKDYKKGLQQAVFGNNGKRTLRFKDDDGNDYPEWVEHKFDDVFGSIPNKKYQIPSSKVLQEGEFEVVDQGQKNIAGYSNDKTKLYSEVPVIVYGDHTTIIKYRNTPFVVGADGTKMLKTKEGINMMFALYSLDFNNVKPTGYNRHFSILREIKLAVPCLEEQEKIANLFSKIDNQIELEEQLLQAAKDEKQGLMQRVF